MDYCFAYKIRMFDRQNDCQLLDYEFSKSKFVKNSIHLAAHMSLSLSANVFG